VDFDPKVIAQLATKYLDRVDIKGLQEFHEFGHMVAFFSAVESGQIHFHQPQPQEPES
jgi:hypothetical protein